MSDVDDFENYRPLADICMDIYREMYRRAEPSVDFDEIVARGEGAKPDWFMNYYLSIDEQEKIVRKHTKGLSDRDYGRVSITVLFGCALNSVKLDE